MFINANIIRIIFTQSLAFTFPIFFCIPFDLGHFFSKQIEKLQFSIAEVLIFEVHVIFFLHEFIDFAETIHVKLSYEGRKLFVSEKLRQNLVFKFFGVLNQDLVVLEPGHVLTELLILTQIKTYLQDKVELLDEIRHPTPVEFKLRVKGAHHQRQSQFKINFFKFFIIIKLNISKNTIIKQQAPIKLNSNSFGGLQQKQIFLQGFSIFQVFFNSITLKRMEPSFILKKQFFITKNAQNIKQVYDIQSKEMGSGAYGRVFRAKHKFKGNTFRAIKEIKRVNIKNLAVLVNQIDLLKKLDHPNVLRLYEIFEDKTNIYLVTDYFEGGDLLQQLQEKGCFSEQDTRGIFQQAVDSLFYCHSHKVAHRDLKPENFMFLDKKTSSVKLIDFGLAFSWKQDMKMELKKKPQKRPGSLQYLSPEVIKNDYDERCDIWSLGVVLYILVTASFPFDGNNEKQIIANIQMLKMTTEINKIKNVSDELKDLLKRMLARESNRISLKEILEHPWMVQSVPKVNMKLNFSKMTSFSKFSKMKTLAVTFIASQMPEKEIEKMGQLFKKIDLNHDGYITVDELKQAFSSQKQKSSLSELSKLMQYIDTDKDGKLNYTEFISCCLDNSTIFKEENMMAAFRLLDRDENGKIEKEELKLILNESNCSSSKEVIDEIMKTCDKDGDGFIDYSEFIAVISKR